MIRPARVSSSRKRIAASPMSAGVSAAGSSARCSGVRSARDRREEGVSTRPGQMQLARTPIESRHGARHAVNRITPALATAYSGQSWLVVPSPATDATVMIAPPPPAAIGSLTSCAASMTPRRFRSSVLPHRTGSAAGKHGSANPPALLTSTPSRDGRRSEASTADRTPASVATSAWTNVPPTPAAVPAPASRSRSAMTTSMPSAASRSAIPAPIPAAPPVTRAVSP
jgi:hypothetical protein